MISFQNLLLFTVLESIPAMTICFVNFGHNLLWLWLKATPETNVPSYFAAHMTQGYGFWAAAWALAAATVAMSGEERVRRVFARGASFIYVMWWPMWFHAVFQTSTWHTYVVVLYGLVRGMQALLYTYYGWIGNDLGIKQKR